MRQLRRVDGREGRIFFINFLLNSHLMEIFILVYLSLFLLLILGAVALDEGKSIREHGGHQEEIRGSSSLSPITNIPRGICVFLLLNRHLVPSLSCLRGEIDVGNLCLSSFI